MSDESTQQEQLLAPLNADRELHTILTAESRIHVDRPKRMLEAYQLVVRALDICASAHRRGGVSSRQLTDLERIRLQIQELLA